MNPFAQLVAVATTPASPPALAQPERTQGGPTLTAALLDELREHGTLSTAELQRRVKLLHSNQVWGLLKVARHKGLVRFDSRSRLWHFAPAVDPVLQETLQWHAPQDLMPNADETVLMHMSGTRSEPVWPGYWDGTKWQLADGAPVIGGALVAHWARMPAGPAGETA